MTKLSMLNSHQFRGTFKTLMNRISTITLKVLKHIVIKNSNRIKDNNMLHGICKLNKPGIKLMLKNGNYLI